MTRQHDYAAALEVQVKVVGILDLTWVLQFRPREI